MKTLKLTDEKAELVVAGLRAIGGTLHQNPDARQAAHWSILIGQMIQELVPQTKSKPTPNPDSKAVSQRKNQK